MDLHPIFIHFPIALLTLYSFCEVVKRFTKGPHWMHMRAFLVITGTIGAFAGLATGEQAEHLFSNRSLHGVLEIHSLLATTTTWAYAVLAVSYVIVLSQKTAFMKALENIMKKPVSVASNIATTILKTPVAPVLATLAFISLSMVGALGAILVYGPDFDPMTQFIHTLLFGG